MPEYAVTLRYTLSWLGRKTVKAKDEETAHARVEAQFSKVSDDASFERWVAEDGTPELETEELKVEDVQEL